MVKRKVYLDNCCFNRPYDDQIQEVIRLETGAKLYLQELIKAGELELVWSFILDFENEANPHVEKKESIAEWRSIAKTSVAPLEAVRSAAIEIQSKTSLKAKDSLHLACAILAEADNFVTTDKQILKKRNLLPTVAIVDPVELVFILEGDHEI